jgi:uncharacterized protein (TIGR02246 family)
MRLLPFQDDESCSDEMEVCKLYWRIVVGWNKRKIDEFSAPFAEDAKFLGADGCQLIGRREIVSTLRQMFTTQVTFPCTNKIESVCLLSPDVALLCAITGIVPPGQVNLNLVVDAYQTLIAAKHDGTWRIIFFQNTSALLNEKPEALPPMTEALRQKLQQLLPSNSLC